MGAIKNLYAEAFECMLRDIEDGDTTNLEELLSCVTVEALALYVQNSKQPDDAIDDADYVAVEDAREFEDFDPITKGMQSAYIDVVSTLERIGDKMTGGQNV